MNKRNFILVVVCVALVAALSAVFISTTGQATILQNEDVKIKISYLPAVQSLLLFNAVENHYFEDAGLDVEIVRFDNPGQIVDSLEAGSTDVAANTGTGIVGIAETKAPGNIKVFGFVCGDLQHLNDELLTRRDDASIKTIADLKGRNLGIIPGIQFKTVAKHILAENNLEVEIDVRIVELAIPLQLQALQSGQVDAVLTLEPVGTIGTEKGISQVFIASPMVRYIADPWCGGAFSISTKFMKEHPVEAKKVISILTKSVDEINASPDKIS
ncbi:MAG: ABC transporter substrate-binding protein [Candidatus Diapherotrites archaeon]|nr:ABC transporter substrate-binding protein [Candidatus Diapherotrites archaeon]